ncbi:MAG: iron ABC transporter permease [Planctomycetota bacterium]|nr:iron ABC transporter permease [Planctomycetota bacterium]
MTPRALVGLLVLLVACVGFLLLRLAVGRVPLESGGWQLVLGWPEDAVRPLRIGAAASAIAAGWSLGLSGLFLQVLLRNPLASPWILGLSSGAGLGVMIALAGASLAGVAAPSGGGLVVPAALGAVGALSITWLLGREQGVLEPLRLLLVGVIVASLAGALSMAVQDVVPHGLRGDFIDWMMGRIPEAPASGVLLTCLVGAATATVVATLGARWIDLSCLGPDEARTSGLNLPALRVALFLGAGALTASAVALVGPIGFVGLLAPHLARVLVGPAHRVLVPATCLAGIAMLLGAEAVRQFIDLGGGRLHVGVLTALLGGPCFLWLLCTNRGWTR